MPSNRITINGEVALSWEVPDSAMEAVIALLDTVGSRWVARDALEESRKDHDAAPRGEEAGSGDVVVEPMLIEGRNDPPEGGAQPCEDE